ncbi:MAG: phosphopantothenoylcysteine decarboxylase [Planctomycetota bacterium]|nr:phosphopantothenoylcysteine decarboxylase [Planctomycetota bacterium]MDA1106248.1 phosphopantothenoylcysteine decarboxylase [Planctomycetota bacterium]
MQHWDFTPPPPSDLGDHEVRLDGLHLEGKRVALMVCGGIAAMKAPMVARALRRQGAEVTAFVSGEGLRYVTADTMSWSCDRPAVTQLTPRAEHLSDAERFDLYLVAPATYNTIGKMAQGVADGLLSATMASAIGRMERGECRILVAPTMHGSMHNSILTDNMRRLQSLGVGFVAPRMDAGKLNLPDEEVLVAASCRALSTSALVGRRVLVTGGPIPVSLDSVRTISNRFTGALSIEIARELELRGADVDLVLGAGSAAAPAWIDTHHAPDLAGYRASVMDLLGRHRHAACVLSAAAADFEPSEVREGKTSSRDGWTIQLQPAAKVIDEVRERHPGTFLVGFKYEEGITTDELLRIGRNRAARDGACVANRGDDFAPRMDGSQPVQVAWICSREPDREPLRVEGKRAIAASIANLLEREFTQRARADRSAQAATAAPDR